MVPVGGVLLDKPSSLCLDCLNCKIGGIMSLMSHNYCEQFAKNRDWAVGNIYKHLVLLLPTYLI